MRRLLLAALLAALAIPAPALAAEELLDTITVPANSSTVIQGTYPLKVGTRYVIEVTGTMKSTNTDGGYGHGYDALYCYEEYNFSNSTSCADARKDPQNRTLRAHDFHLSSGSITNDWRLADQFLTTSRPFQDTPAVDYDPNHSYTLGFYPPADGPIKAQTYYAATGGCPNCTNSTTGTFTVKVFGQPATTTPPPPPPSTNPEPACASAAMALARASQQQPCGGTCAACRKFGTTYVSKAPEPNKPIQVGDVTMDPEARQILFDAGITDASSQQLIAAMILQAKASRLREQFWGCLHIGTLAPDPYRYPGDYSARNPQKLSAMVVACSKMIADEAEKEAAAGKPIAVASQTKKCNMLFFPIYRNKRERKSAKRRRQIAAAVKKAVTGGCAAGAGQLSFSLKSKRKGVPLYKLTNRKVKASLVRVAPKGTPTPANAKLYTRWSRP